MNQADIFRYVVAGVMVVILIGSIAAVTVAAFRSREGEK